MRRLVFIYFLCLNAAACTAVREKQIVNAAKPQEIFATDISYDPQTGVIQYTLPEAALVRIRLGIKEGGPLLRTLVDWELRKKGEHREIWDKKDKTGLVDFSGYQDLLIVLAGVSSDIDPRAGRLDAIRGLRKSPEFKITFPQSTQKTKDGIVILQAVTPVRIGVNKEDIKWLSETKYELGMYIDHNYFMEDEEGSNPFTYQLDTSALNDGIHTITINITTYQGEIGTKSVLIYVENHQS